MSATTPDDGNFVTVGVDAADLDRYDVITLENGEILIYSHESDEEWIQSDDYIHLDVML